MVGHVHNDVGGVTLLGHWIPSRLESWCIGKEFRELQFIPDCCRKSDLEVRYPSVHRPATADMWHKDFMTPYPKHLTMWTNESPTQVLIDDHVIEFAPYDVIQVDNITLEHRMPPDANCMTRWFLCFRCTES